MFNETICCKYIEVFHLYASVFGDVAQKIMVLRQILWSD